MMFFRLLPVMLLVTASCKETGLPEKGEDMIPPYITAKVTPEKERYADSTREIDRGSEFYFKIWDQTFTNVLSELPTSGSVPDEKKPYSGYWYPERFGGTNVQVSAGQSPMQKYDEAFNDGEDKAAAWERANHTVDANDPSASWAGHCNGFAAAAQRHKEPEKSVKRGGVTFTAQDIKALLAEIHMSAKYFFLGGNRCELEGRLPGPTVREDPAVMDVCEDINPGTLHVNIANWIGRKRHTLILDQSINYQVWNYPLYAYEVITSGEISKAQARQAVAGRTGSVYEFNPDAVKFFQFRTRLTYANALDREALGSTQPGYFDLTYVLELNGAGEVIGGEWTGESQRNHPDFLWLAFEPVQGDGSRFFGNPHIDPDKVIKMWAESAGFNPDNPPLDLLEPNAVDEWGRFPNFEVTIDGNDRGVVFSGKATNLEITRRGPLREAVNLAVILDGDEIAEKDLNSGNSHNLQFNTGFGLHRLQMKWTKGDTELDDRSIRFVVVP